MPQQLERRACGRRNAEVGEGIGRVAQRLLRAIRERAEKVLEKPARVSSSSSLDAMYGTTHRARADRRTCEPTRIASSARSTGNDTRDQSIGTRRSHFHWCPPRPVQSTTRWRSVPDCVARPERTAGEIHARGTTAISVRARRRTAVARRAVRTSASRKVAIGFSVEPHRRRYQRCHQAVRPSFSSGVNDFHGGSAEYRDDRGLAASRRSRAIASAPGARSRHEQFTVGSRTSHYVAADPLSRRARQTPSPVDADRIQDTYCAWQT